MFLNFKKNQIIESFKFIVPSFFTEQQLDSELFFRATFQTGL